MPIIVPPSRNEVGDVIVELEALGGKAKQDFRMTRNRSNEVVLEVSDELYGKWDSGKTKRVGRKADESDGETDAESDAENDDTADSQKSSARKRR